MPKIPVSHRVAMLLLVLCSGATGFAQTYTADQFNIGSAIGLTMHFDGSWTETEYEYWVGPDPIYDNGLTVGDVVITSANEIIDGHVTNALILFPSDVPGPPDYGGSPAIFSDTEGFINFGDHPNKTGEREHFINGITWIPGSMTIGDSFADTRSTAWEGHWDGEQDWTGTLSRTISIIGFEQINHATYGPINALRINSVDNRTKNGNDGQHWATENWQSSFWLAEGMGLIRFQQTELKQHFYSTFDSGNSPIGATEYEEIVDITYSPEPTSIAMLSLGTMALLRGRRR